MKLIEFCQMKKRDSNMMLFVNDDLVDDLVERDEVLILVDFDDLVIEQVLILIFEIYFDEFFDDLVVEDLELKNEKI